MSPHDAGAASPPSHRNHQNLYAPVKLALEWLAALVMLAAAIPLLAALAVLLKLTSHGPVFYSQMRLGRGGRPFRIYKLRTMTHGCESATGPVWASTADPRITRVGRWLRDTHLDEVPQLWNILRGDMSVVGPRPIVEDEIIRYGRDLPIVLSVKPGLTGLWQVSGRNDVDYEERVALDKQYVLNR
jgi:lipopolysaccharide/colanic/teichoic acid biosynthesis glycosyltransferase